MGLLFMKLILDLVIMNMNMRSMELPELLSNQKRISMISERLNKKQYMLLFVFLSGKKKIELIF